MRKHLKKIITRRYPISGRSLQSCALTICQRTQGRESGLFSAEAEGLSAELAAEFMEMPGEARIYTHSIINFNWQDYELLGETESERKAGLMNATRELLRIAATLSGQKARWFAGAHLDTNPPHVHVISDATLPVQEASEVLRQVTALNRLGTHILIAGDSDSIMSATANLVHQQSARSERPLVTRKAVDFKTDWHSLMCDLITSVGAGTLIIERMDEAGTEFQAMLPVIVDNSESLGLPKFNGRIVLTSRTSNQISHEVRARFTYIYEQTPGRRAAA